jgi:putative DNA primase/helicase
MYENIPNELKSIPNWVCWRAIPDANSHSGIKKIPVNPHTGGQAMSNNPQTWSSFETAVRACANYDGIGFMFSGSGYFGVDLDDMNESLANFLDGSRENIISEFVDGLQTYAEQSQSGNGIHLICRGSLPSGGRRKGKIEMYDSGRFFIMTGNAIGNYPYISDCTERIKPLHRKYLNQSMTPEIKNSSPKTTNLSQQEIIHKIMNSQSGEKFKALYNGNFSGYPSQSEADMALCSMLAFWCGGDTELMDSIYRSSGLMRDKWDRKQSGSTYGKLLMSKAVSGCQSFYEPQCTNKYSSVSKNQSPTPEIPMHSLDDTGNAERMNDYCGKCLRYNYTDKRWMYYKGGKWHYDDRGMVYVAADGVLERMKFEMKTWAENESSSRVQEYEKHMKKTRSNASKRAMIKEFEHIVSISPADLDSNELLVNSRNGILDLTTGKISPHNSELYMTRMLGTSIPLQPKSPELWLKFLDDIFSGDKELIRYVQKALGYSLSGLTKEQCLFFLYGTGRNGKSTFLEIIRKIMGDYASNIQPESIMIKNISGNANTDIARLKGARLVTSVEPNEGMRLNEGLLKQLTGDDMITARKLYGDEFEYRPEFKLWIATNHKPTIRGTDIGIWRRIHIIPFTVTIPDEKVDKNLSEKLTEELPDILAWMIEGYRLWRYEGLHKPKAVEDSVKEYRNEMDVIAAFLDSDYVMESGEVKASVLYAVYCKWADEGNEFKMPSRKFGIEMTKRFTKKMKNGCVYYQGITAPVSINQ